jgi:hypothetical protein
MISIFLVSSTTLVFFDGSTRYQMQAENFSKFFRCKNKTFGPVPRNTQNELY